MADTINTHPRVSVRFDEATGIHYLVGSASVIFENNVRIDRAIYEIALKAKKSIADIITEATKNKDNFGWDYKHALRTATLQRLKAAKEVQVTPDIESQVKEAPADPVLAEKKVKARSAPLVSQAKAFFSAPYTDIIIMVLFVGLLSMSMSIYHTCVFLIETGKSTIVAIIGAVTMVTFSASAYTAARNVFQDHGIGFFARIFFSSFLVVCGTATIAFSVFSTVNVSYEQFRATQKVATVTEIAADPTVVAKKGILDIKTKRISDAEVTVANYERDKEEFVKAMNKPLPEGLSADDPVYARALVERVTASRNYAYTQTMLARAEAARDTLYKEAEDATATHLRAVDTASRPETTAYKMVSEKLGISERDIEFIIYTVPAVFFDIISPFAIAIVLLLKDRRKGVVKLSFFDKLTDLWQNKLLRGK